MAQLSNKKLLWPLALILPILLIFSIIPLPVPHASNCIAVIGKVTGIQTGDGAADIVVKVAGDNGYYYINRGLENGLKLSSLSDQLINKTAKVYYMKHWSLLNFDSKTRHVARIEVGEDVLYDEWVK